MKTANILLPALCGAALVLSGQGTAQVVLIGNYPPNNNGSNQGVLTTQWGAVSFTMPSTAYTIDSVKFRFSNYSTTGGDVAVVGFYTDNGNEPGTLVGSNLLAPSSSSNLPADFTFTPNGTVSLDADTKYWLRISASAGIFSWTRSTTETPVATTPVGEATFGSYRVTTTSGSSWSDVVAGRNYTFQISATAVPEPEQYAIATGLCLLGLAGWHRRQQRRAC